jgi:hypothetical protein
MANNINWGQGAVNNLIGWGKGAINNLIGWGAVHANSYSPETNLTGSNGSEPTTYNFALVNCAGNSQIVYSSSATFAPGIYVYTNVGLTIPFITLSTWNTSDVLMMYNIAANGLVLNTGNFCD